jgi:hypothetical protein
MSSREQRLLDIKTARMRYEWAKAEALREDSSLALAEYVKESLKELRLLKSTPLKKNPPVNRPVTPQ